MSPSYVLPLLTGAAFRVANCSVAFTERGHYGDRQPRSGSPGALPRRGPLRTVRARFPGTRSSKPRRLAGRLSSWPLRCTAGGLPTRAVGVHEAECGGVRPGPVVGQGAVVRRRAAGDHLVPDDSRSGELDQVSAAVAVIEHPAVPSGRVEHAEVPGDDPAPRLVRMGPVGPPCR
jgi:hypothetical protein